MWLLAIVVPFVSLLVLGYLVMQAPEVTNDTAEQTSKEFFSFLIWSELLFGYFWDENITRK